MRVLRDNARLTNAELGERVGLSPSQCSRRRHRLEALGAVASYATHLNAAVLGLLVTAFVEVTLPSHSPAVRAAFLRIVETTDAIQSCHAVTGRSDYILRVLVTDLAALNVLVNALLHGVGDGVRVQSLVVLERLKDNVSIV